MSNNLLRVVLTEHHEDDWQRNSAQITGEIDNADIVIPEYRPREYSHLRYSSNPLYRRVAKYDKRNGLFEHVADLCIERKKPVWVVDPEYNEQGIDLRIKLYIPSVLTEIATAIGLIETVDGYSEEKLSRRRLLRGLPVLAVAAAGGAQAFNDFSLAIFTEKDFRHVVSAEMLDRLDKSGKFSPSGTKPKVTMFIPKGHWQESKSQRGIKYYLTHPEDRSERLKLYTRLFGKQFPALFEARYYPPGDASNNPKDKIKIPL